jgi:hypothetical protein
MKKKKDAAMYGGGIPFNCEFVYEAQIIEDRTDYAKGERLKEMTSKSFHFRPFGVSVLAYHIKPTMGWVRIFGKGLRWKDVAIHGLLFSERHLNRGFLFGKWHIGLLR